jgi:hypothetical protein
MGKKIEYIYNLPAPVGSIATHEQLRDYVTKLGMSLSRWSFESHLGSDLDANVDGGSPNDVYTADQVIDGGGI